MIEIRPYVHFDGMPTFRNTEILSFYEQMEKDGTAETVFWDETINSKHEFLQHVKSHGALLLVALMDSVPVGICWLNGFECGMARLHFCIFSIGWKNSLEIGKALVQKAININKDINMLIGFVPESNKKAIGFCLKCGAKHLGSFPRGSRNSKNGDFSMPTAVLYYLK